MTAPCPPHSAHVRNRSTTTTTTTADEIELTGPQDDDTTTPDLPPRQHPSSSHSALAKWWRKHIAPIVPYHECRDHLALERTFLAYLRTANAFALFGVATAQLFRLDSSTATSADPVSTFFRLGRRLGATAEAMAILVVLVGAFRCWRQQGRLVAGRVKAGAGWEMWMIGAAAGVYLLITLALNAGDTAATATTDAAAAANAATTTTTTNIRREAV